MKICFVIADTAVLMPDHPLVKLLQARPEIEASFVLLSVNPAATGFGVGRATHPNLTIFRIDMPPIEPLSTSDSSLSCAFRQLLASCRPDVVHFLSTPARAAADLIHVAKQLGLRVLWTAGDPFGARGQVCPQCNGDSPEGCGACFDESLRRMHLATLVEEADLFRPGSPEPVESWFELYATFRESPRAPTGQRITVVILHREHGRLEEILGALARQNVSSQSLDIVIARLNQASIGAKQFPPSLRLRTVDVKQAGDDASLQQILSSAGDVIAFLPSDWIPDESYCRSHLAAHTDRSTGDVAFTSNRACDSTSLESPLGRMLFASKAEADLLKTARRDWSFQRRVVEETPPDLNGDGLLAYGISARRKASIQAAYADGAVVYHSGTISLDEAVRTSHALGQEAARTFEALARSPRVLADFMVCELVAGRKDLSDSKQQYGQTCETLSRSAFEWLSGSSFATATSRVSNLVIFTHFVEVLESFAFVEAFWAALPIDSQQQLTPKPPAPGSIHNPHLLVVCERLPSFETNGCADRLAQLLCCLRAVGCRVTVAALEESSDYVATYAMKHHGIALADRLSEPSIEATLAKLFRERMISGALYWDEKSLVRAQPAIRRLCRDCFEILSLDEAPLPVCGPGARPILPEWLLEHGASQANVLYSSRALGGIRAEMPILAIDDQPRRSSDTQLVTKSGLQLAELIRRALPAASNRSRAVRRVPAVASIVIPLFNKVELTRACLDSLLEHPSARYQMEIVFVDNGSTDGTAAYLTAASQRHPNVLVVTNEKNLGFAKACNQGAVAAHGDTLLFLNNDTEVWPGWLDPLMEELANPCVGAAGSKLLYADGTIQHAGMECIRVPRESPFLPVHPFRNFAADYPAASFRRTCDSITGACLAIPADLFAEVGGFDENYWNGCEDVDLCFKIAERGFDLVYNPQSVVTHFEAQSGPERFRLETENLARLRRKWASSVSPVVLDSIPLLEEHLVQRIAGLITTERDMHADLRT